MDTLEPKTEDLSILTKEELKALSATRPRDVRRETCTSCLCKLLEGELMTLTTPTILCINVQTTGLVPAKGHILEVAVVAVRLAPAVAILGEHHAYCELPSTAVIEDGAMRVHERSGLLADYVGSTPVHLPHWLSDVAKAYTGVRILASSQGSFCTDWLRAHDPGFLNVCFRNHYLDPDCLTKAFGAALETTPSRALPRAQADAGALVQFAGALGVPSEVAA